MFLSGIIFLLNMISSQSLNLNVTKKKKTSHHSLSISHLNIKGLHDARAGCKLSDNNFLKNVLNQGCDHDISVPGFEKIILKPNKKQHVSGRSSGGIVLFYKVHLKGRIHLLKCSKNYIWIELKSCINDLSATSEDIYLCAIYIPPDCSPYYLDGIFTNIQSDILNYSKNDDFIILVGDFNARTSTNSDFVETVGDKYLANTHNAFIVNCNRNNQDSHLNNHRKNILDLCKSCSVRIINGRKSGDSFGKNTYYSNEGKGSTIDYLMVSDSFYDEVTSFVVKPQTEMNDHFEIIAWLNASDKFSNCLEPRGSYSWKKLASSFHWNNLSPQKFRSPINSNQIKSHINKFKRAYFDNSERESVMKLMHS